MSDSIDDLIEMTRIQLETHFPEGGVDLVGVMDQRAAAVRDQVQKTWGHESTDPAFWEGVLIGTHWTGLLVQHLFQAVAEQGGVVGAGAVLRVLVSADAVAGNRAEVARAHAKTTDP